MKTHFLAACLRTQTLLALKKAPLLLAMALVALLLGLVAAAAGGLAFGGNGSGFSGVVLAVADEGGDERIDTALQMFAGTEEFSRLATVVRTTPTDAAAMVQGGKATAAVIVPAGFFDSILSGENLSPRLVVDASRPLEAALVTKLAEAAVRMLGRAQQGVAFTLQAAQAQPQLSTPIQNIVWDINLQYASWLLGKDSMFRTSTLGLHEGLSLTQSYLLSAGLFFCLLSVPVLYSLYSHTAQQSWLRRLRAAGCPLPVYAFAQVAAGALALCLMLLALLGGAVGAGFAMQGQGQAPLPAALPTLLLVSFTFSCYGFLCCNCGRPLLVSGLNFALATLLLLVSGGLVPLVLLPQPLAALAPFSMLTWARQALAPVFGVKSSFAALGGISPLLQLAVLAAALLAFALGLAHRRERRAA